MNNVKFIAKVESNNSNTNSNDLYNYFWSIKNIEPNVVNVVIWTLNNFKIHINVNSFKCYKNNKDINAVN